MKPILLLSLVLVLASSCDSSLLTRPDAGSEVDAGNDAGIDDRDEKAFQAALALYTAMQYQQAIEAFTRFLDDYPNSARVDNATYLIARSHFELGEYGTARHLLEQFLADHPDSKQADEARYFLGRSLYELMQYTEAVTVFTALFELHPASQYVDNGHYYRGRSHFSLADYPAALLDFQVAITDRTSSARDASLLWAGRSEYELALLDVTVPSPHFTSADNYFLALIADYPGGVYEDNARYYYGLTALEVANYVEAIARFSQLLTSNPNSFYAANAHYHRGYCYYRNGDYQLGLDDFAALLAADPTGIYGDNATYYSGRCEYRLAAYAAAISFFQTLITSFASSSYVDNAYYYEINAYILVPDCISARTSLTTFSTAQPGSPFLPQAQIDVASSCP